MKNSAVICFVCGSKGANCVLFVKPRSKGAYFSFLEHHDPPKGAKLPNGEGVVSACLVCYAFLNQQWDSFEKTKTPLVKRLYWLKRVDNRSFTGAELNIQGEYVAQIMGVQYNCGMPGNVSPFDYGNHTGISCSVKNPLPSPGNDSNLSPLVDNHDERNNEVLDLSVSPKKVKGQQKKFQKGEEVNGGGIGTKPSSALSSSGNRQKNGSIVCYICAKMCPETLARFVYATDHADHEPYFPFILELAVPPGAMAVTKKGVTQVCSECRKTLSRQWRFFDSQKIPEVKRVYKIKNLPIEVHKLPQVRVSRDVQEVDTDESRSTGSGCYLCGELTLLSLMHSLKARGSEPDSDGATDIVLPFIEKLKCPLGARPINSQGVVLVCSPCHSHILSQWKQFEEGDFPAEKRKYLLRPYLNGTGSVKFPSNFQAGVNIPNDSMALEMTNSQRIPFFNSIAALSKSEKMEEFGGSVFHPSVVEQLSMNGTVAADCSEVSFRMPYYDSSLQIKTDCNKNMMMKPGSATPDSMPCNGHAISKDHTHQSDAYQMSPQERCFLCGSVCKKSRECWSSSVPIYDRPSTNAPKITEDNKTCVIRPFFPFLTKLTPCAGASAMSDDGRANVCQVCYHNLVSQWHTFEKSKDIEQQNRWLRKYRYRLFNCVICKQVSSDRQKVQIVEVREHACLQGLGGVTSADDDGCALVCLSCLSRLKVSDECNGKRNSNGDTVDLKTSGMAEESAKAESHLEPAGDSCNNGRRKNLSPSTASNSPPDRNETQEAERRAAAAAAGGALASSAAGHRLMGSRRSRRKSSTEEKPAEHLFPGGGGGGRGGSSCLEALKRLAMDSSSRACWPRGDLSSSKLLKTGELCAGERRTTTPSESRTCGNQIQECQAEADISSSSQLKIHVGDITQNHNQNGVMAVKELEDAGRHTAPPGSAPPSIWSNIPSSPLLGVNSLFCSSGLANSSESLNSDFLHHQSRIAAPLPLVPEAVYLPRLVNPSAALGFPLAPSPLRWEDYLTMQKYHSMVPYPYSHLFPPPPPPPPLVRPFMPPSLTPSYLYPGNHPPGPFNSSSASNLLSIFQRRDVCTPQEVQDGELHGEVDVTSEWNTSRQDDVKGCLSQEKKEDDEKLRIDRDTTPVSEERNELSAAVPVERTASSGDEVQRLPNNVHVKPNFHRPFLEDAATEDGEGKEPGLHLSKKPDEFQTKNKSEREKNRTTDHKTPVCSSFRIDHTIPGHVNQAPLLKYEFSDEAKASTTGEASAEGGAERKAASDLGHPPNGCIPSSFRKFANSLNGTSISVPSDVQRKDDQMSAAISLIFLHSSTANKAAKRRSASQPDSPTALNNEDPRDSPGSNGGVPLNAVETNGGKRLRLDSNHSVTSPRPAFEASSSGDQENEMQYTPAKRLRLQQADRVLRPTTSPASSDDPGHVTSLQWPGVEAIIESYQQYCQDYAIERQFLLNQCHQLCDVRQGLVSSREMLSLRIQEMTQTKQELECGRLRLQSSLDCLTYFLRHMR